MENKNIKICVLGAGNIGAAMVRGLAGSGVSVSVWNRSARRLEGLAPLKNVSCSTDMAAALDSCDIALVCVEGRALDSVTAKMASLLGTHKPIVGSCAAASTLAGLSESLSTPDGPHTRVFRLLPNIGATVGMSTNLYCSAGLSEAEDRNIIGLFGATGTTAKIEERHFQAAMALSSCGIAYALRYVRATMQAGVQAGLDPDTACALSAGAVKGAMQLLQASEGLHPEALVDSVCTPGGVTIRGLNAMEDAGFSAAVVKGLLATLTR